MALFGGRRITRAGILFIVGVLVLGALVTGGIFMVKSQGEAVRRDEAIKIAEQTLKDQSEVATQSVNTPESTETDAESASAGSDGVVVATTTDAETLPETGPEALQGLGQFVIIAVLAFSVATYISSRRATS